MRIPLRRIANYILLFIMIQVLCAAVHSSASAFSFSSDLVQFERAKDYFKKGVHFFNKYQYLAAVEFFRNAVSAYPDYNTAREYLARSYKYAGFTDEALKEWESLSNINTENVYIRNKIDTIRFRSARGSLETDFSRLILSEEYVSGLLKRFRFPAPVDIAVDGEKNLYVTSFSGGKVSKFDSNGRGLSTFSPTLTSKIYGIDSRGSVLAVTDFKYDTVYILDHNFNIKKKFGGTGKGEGQFHGPEGVAIDHKGNVYVVDAGNHRVQKFDDAGNFILKFGRHGEYEGQFDNPTDVCIHGNRVYVTDTGNNRIAAFDDSGNFIKNITRQNLVMPRGISAFRNTLLVSDETRGLFFYDLHTGKSRWFRSWEGGKKRFAKLFTTTSDRDGLLYCLDHLYEKVFVFSPPEITYTNLDVEVTSIETRDYPTVAVYLNIRDRGGKPVYALKRENFRVSEDNAVVTRLNVDYMRTRNPSVSMVLCVDRSTQSKGFHNELPWVSEFILRKMRVNDKIKVLNFNRDFWTGNAFDWSRRRTLKALQERRYGQGQDTGAVLYNAISDLIPSLSRRAVVLLTSGSVSPDSFNRYTSKYIIEYARNHYIPIHIITFNPADEELERIAGETGGKLLRASNAAGLNSLYDEIKRGEEYRYMLLYHSFKMPTFKGWWTDLKINIDYKGQRGYEWGGYFVP